MSYDRSILVVEDDANSALQITGMLTEMGYQVASVTDSASAALQLVHDLRPGLVISNFHLAGEAQGLQVAAQARSSDLPVILISGHADDTIFQRVKAVQPLAFLVKPFDRYTLQGAIELADTSRPEPSADLFSDSIFVKSNNLLVRVRTSDIWYVHAEGNHSTIVLPGKRLVVKMSLAQISELLDPQDFIQVHRNYLVRLSEIESISLSHNELVIQGQIIPISRQKFRDDLLRRVRMLR